MQGREVSKHSLLVRTIIRSIIRHAESITFAINEKTLGEKPKALTGVYSCNTAGQSEYVPQKSTRVESSQPSPLTFGNAYEGKSVRTFILKRCSD